MGNCAAAIFQRRDTGILKTFPRQTIALNFKFSFGMTCLKTLQMVTLGLISLGLVSLMLTNAFLVNSFSKISAPKL